MVIILDYMKLALQEAYKSFEKGEVPVGAVIVKDNKIISVGHNLKETNNDVTQHAEIIAIQRASKALGTWRLNGCEMYVTLEPCVMCTGAILHSRLSKLHIGSFNKDMGCCGSVMNLVDNRRLGAFLFVNWCYDDRCSKILTEFFEERRKSKND